MDLLDPEMPYFSVCKAAEKHQRNYETIIASLTYDLSNAQVEAINNKIKVLFRGSKANPQLVQLTPFYTAILGSLLPPRCQNMMLMLKVLTLAI